MSFHYFFEARRFSARNSVLIKHSFVIDHTKVQTEAFMVNRQERIIIPTDNKMKIRAEQTYKEK